MSETLITLTEDQIICTWGTQAECTDFKNEVLVIGDFKTREETEQVKQQILTALEQYTELQEMREYYENQSNLLLKRIIELENTRNELKAEIESLKDKNQSLQREIYARRTLPYSEKEIESLRQLKQRVKEILKPFPEGDLDIDAPEDCISACKKLQQLLKES